MRVNCPVGKLEAVGSPKGLSMAFNFSMGQEGGSPPRECRGTPAGEIFKRGNTLLKPSAEHRDLSELANLGLRCKT